jgi:glycosyltransferase involved in cell wall biosynthesis
MIPSPRILTTRWIIKKEWLNNTINIYEDSSIPAFTKLPVSIRKRITSLYKYLNKFDVFVGTRLFLNRKKIDIIVSATILQAITYSFLNSVFLGKKKLHILDSIYLNEPDKFKSKIKPFILRPFLQKVDYIHVNSTREIENYSKVLKIDRNKFWFYYYPSHVKNPRIIDSDEGYILSAGKQYRDYATLIKAVKGTGYKLIIVSDEGSMKEISPCDEVTVFYNISKEKYFDLLFKSKFVVVPLSSDFCSCGQIAFLDAMAYGKPVIVAKVTGSIDYIEDGKSGLFYEKGNELDLRSKIKLLNENKELRDSIAQEALSAIINNFNYEVLVTKFCQFIDEKWKEKNDQ